jgi:hypothetical protein
LPTPSGETIVPILRALLLGLALVGCSGSGTSPSLSVPAEHDLRLRNATDRALAFFAIAADLSPLLDPIPEASVDESWVRLVQPGAERPVGEVEGRESAPNGGVAIYLYPVTPDGERVRFQQVVLVTGEELRRNSGRIVIR